MGHLSHFCARFPIFRFPFFSSDRRQSHQKIGESIVIASASVSSKLTVSLTYRPPWTYSPHEVHFFHICTLSLHR
jgi:hypothetical protein